MGSHRVFRTFAKVSAVTFVIGIIGIIGIIGSPFSLASYAVAATPVQPATIDIPRECEVAYSDVEVALSGLSGNAVSGEDMIVKTVISNRGDSPLIDISLAARVVRMGAGAGGFYAVDDIVDRFVVANDIQLPGNTAVPLSFAWRVPRGIASGLYRINVYAVSAEQFAVSGAEWSDSSANARLGFQVTGDAKEVSYLDTSSLRVNDMRLFKNRFVITSGAIATGTINILNNFAETRGVSVIWKVYSSEIINESRLVSYNLPEKINLPPGQKTVYSFIIPTISDPLSHVVLELIDGEKKSIYSFRILEKKATHSIITNLGLSAFPIKAGEKVEVFGCVSSSIATRGGLSKTLRLSIINTIDETVAANLGSTTVGGLFSSFSRKFTPPADFKNSIVFKAELIDKLSGKVESTATLAYSCNKLVCPRASLMEFFNQLGVRDYYIVLILGILGVIVTRFVMKKKRGNSIKMP